MENQTSRLQELYDLACLNGLAKNKGEFATLIGIDRSSLSHALKDDGKVSLDNTIKSAELALMKAGISVNASGDGSTAQSVVGNNNTIGLPQKKFEHEGEWFALVAEKDKQIDRLLSIIEKMQNN